MSNKECFHCHRIGAEQRFFAWDYRPRAKDLSRGHVRDENATLKVRLCDSCYSIVNGIKLVGWDWWDAYDGIHFALEDAESKLR